jgi:8-oxo-dGTP pyrophosphatase MutT (NUDIX family)
VFVLAARTGADGGKRFLLQLRARPDDPYRGQLDALAGGHVSALESHLEGAVREAREEAGVDLRADELVYLGERFLENPAGVCRRVIEHFYLCVRPLRLTETAFTREANGFVEVDLDEFAELLEGTRERLDGQARRPDRGDAVHPIEITAEFLAAYSGEILDDFRRSLRAVRSYLDTGEVDRGVWI